MHIGNLTHLTMLVLCLAIRLCDQFLPFSVQFFTIVGDVGILVLVWSSLASFLNKEKYVRTFLRQYTVPVFLGLLITLLTFVRASVTLTTASGDLYTTLTHIQNITLGIFALIAFKAQKKFAERAVSNPSQMLIVSFLVVIFIGTHLLMFPGATSHSQPLPMLTALFTATSAVCVTGLSVIDVATQLSTWGKAILAALIQIGGLGFMVFSFFGMITIKKKMSLESRLVASHLVSDSDMGSLSHNLKLIIFSTFFIEALSALFLFVGFSQTEGYTIQSLGNAYFHAISAFCNAGFSLYPNSLESFVSNPWITFPIAFTIILGGISFVVIDEVLCRVHGSIKNIFFKGKNILGSLSLNTFVVLKATVLLLAVSFVGIYLLEHTHSMKVYQVGTQYLAAFFQAVTLRTAGFSTIPFSNLRTATLFFMTFIMFVGGASGSTAGGIKLNTAAAIIASFRSFIHHDPKPRIRNLVIQGKQVERSFLILGFGICTVCLAGFCLSLTDNIPFIYLLFESVSAFATVGLSVGITANLSTAGLMILLILMFTGRVGTLTILTAASKEEQDMSVEYACGDLAIG